MTRRALVHRVPTTGPNDVHGLAERIEGGEIDPAAIVAILGKTEGNGCVNDFTRGFAVQSLRAALAPHLPNPAALDAVSMVMSGGTEGGLSPHLLVMETRQSQDHGDGDRESLAIGVAHTPTMRPEQIGRIEQCEAVADAVRQAMDHASIGEPENVHYVQVKCPLLTASRVEDAAAQGCSVASTDTLKSMGLSRGAAALGVALALGEIDRGVLDEVAIGTPSNIFATRASCSAGVELMNNEIVVLGNSRHWTSDLVIGHAVMADAIDADAVYRALASIGLEADRQITPDQRGQAVAVLAKAEPDPSGSIRGARHTMLDDSDIAATRHARALVGGVLAGIVGHTELFVSGGAEHQGPPGGGPVAIIARA
ncbi:MAG: ring-opening amidohydrolase [Pseudomonadota bacterium]